MSKITLLDCTLRDASYPVDFQFTIDDTATIVGALDRAGVTRIEVGHGLGLGASGPRHGRAAASDEQYLEAAAAAASRALVGVFLIPGIADLGMVEMAARRGAGFVRIGTDVTRTEDAVPFVEKGKALGLEVSCNLMKSYALDAAQVAERSSRLARYGADVVAVVDSAGGMLPRDVASYVRALVEGTAAEIGFHGHNNLQLAVANALAAAEAGASVLDATLRGMGRSAGNAQTEVLALALAREGHETGLDVFRLMDLGDRLVGPWARGRGVDSLEMTLGYALFHSGFLPIVLEVAAEAGVDPRRLAIAVSERATVDVTEDLVRDAAAALSAEAREGSADAVPVRAAPPVICAGLEEKARRLADRLHVEAAKTGRHPVFVIAQTPVATGGGPVFPAVRDDAALVVGSVEIETAQEAATVAAAVDGRVRTILVDRDEGLLDGGMLEAAVRAAVRASRVLPYRDRTAHLMSALALIDHLGLLDARDGRRPRLTLAGLGRFGIRLAEALLEAPVDLFIAGEDGRRADALSLLRDAVSAKVLPGHVAPYSRAAATLDAVVGSASRRAVIDAGMIDGLGPEGIVIDAGIGTVATDAIARAAERGLALYRLDMRAGLLAQIHAALETSSLVEEAYGASVIAGAPVVAGGALGARGAVVVDRIDRPSEVIGIADGRGALLDGEEARPFGHLAEAVRTELLRRRVAPIEFGWLTEDA